MEILIGLLIIAVGSFGQSSSYVPIRKVRDWSWESFWLVQGIFAWIVFPWLGASLALPEGVTLGALWAAGGAWQSVFNGVLWGVGGLTFGLSMRYLGVALGQSIALGTCAAFGTLFPALLAGQNLFRGEGLALLLGVCITLAGIAVIGYAGSLRSRLLSDEERRAAVKDFALTKGLLVALLAGAMSACFSLGLESGAAIQAAAVAAGVKELFALNPVILLVTLGDQCRLLHLLQREKPHGPRLLLGTGGRVGQQRALLRAGRRAVVLAVLRAGHGQELLRRGAADAGLLVEHPHVAQRAVQQSVGHPAARVARRRPPYGGGARDGSADPDLFDRISATGKIEKTMKLIDNESLDRQIGVVAEVAGYLWERGWAERNGGNISVNVTGLCADAVCELPALDGPYPLPKPVPHIAGGCFLVTGTGRRMRYVASQPLANVALIRVAADGASYEIVADEPVRPTSELPAHLSVHDYLIGAGRPERAVVHTHPIELVAMTHNPEFLGKDVLTRLLWSMIPETRAFCPKGLGIVPYTLPGSQELADRTIALLDDYDVVMWTKHGALAIGTDLIEAFDQIDVLSKSAKIYESARSMGFVPTGMSDAEMQELKEVFGL